MILFVRLLLLILLLLLLLLASRPQQKALGGWCWKAFAPHSSSARSGYRRGGGAMVANLC